MGIENGSGTMPAEAFSVLRNAVEGAVEGALRVMVVQENLIIRLQAKMSEMDHRLIETEDWIKNGHEARLVRIERKLGVQV